MTKQETILAGTCRTSAITSAVDPLVLKRDGGIPFSDVYSIRYREVDQSLQRLRKANKIEYTAASGWRVVVPREAVES